MGNCGCARELTEADPSSNKPYLNSYRNISA